MHLFELFEIQAVPQAKFTGELEDILYNLNLAKLIPRSAVKNPAMAYKALEPIAKYPLLGTSYHLCCERNTGR